MLEPTIIKHSYRIGKNWLFHRDRAKGYKVVRENDEIVDFKEVYELKKNEKNDYDVTTYQDVPIGVIRKSVEIMENNKYDRSIEATKDI